MVFGFYHTTDMRTLSSLSLSTPLHHYLNNCRYYSGHFFAYAHFQSNKNIHTTYTSTIENVLNDYFICGRRRSSSIIYIILCLLATSQNTKHIN